MSAHSKLPLRYIDAPKVGDFRILDANGTQVAATYMRGPSDEADAAFLVLAANNFDALREALQRILSLYRPNHHGQTCGIHFPDGECDCLFGEARAILAATAPASAPGGDAK